MPRQWLLVFCLLPSLVAANEPATAVAEAGNWQPTTTAFARVSARQQVIQGLPFAARIVELAVEPGARVAAGDVMARFDAPLLRQHLAAWQQARLEVQLAQKRLKVLRESQSQHAITRRELVAGSPELRRQIARCMLEAGACGMAVPFFDYAGERPQLNNWACKKGKKGIRAYWKEKNQLSLDGKPTFITEKNG